MYLQIYIANRINKTNTLCYLYLIYIDIELYYTILLQISKYLKVRLSNYIL